jgi:capsular polysaccharide transport system ATP-binding protein
MITLTDVTKIYGTRDGPHCVLDGISFALERGQSLGIVGRNGAGKSTLTRLMSGIEFPTSGRVRRHMSVSWPLGYAGAFQGSLTGADNTRFIARIYGTPLQRTLAFVEEFAELGNYFRMPIKTYSAGMRARLAFAVSLAVDFDCYLVDEITGAGDFRFRERCQKALNDRRQRGALVMISHDPDTLRAYCATGALLHQGRLTFFATIDEALAAYHAL